MAKNLIPKIAELLGLELGEKFKIKGDVGTYEFGLEGLWGDYGTDAEALEAILCGSAEIVKLPWKPKYDDVFYTFLLDFKDDGDGYVWKVAECFWDDSPVDFAFLKAGWAFRTRAEAQAALPAVAKEIGAEYELPTSYTETVEQEENSMRELLGKDIAFMKKTTNGVTKPYTLRQLRLDVEAHKEIDLFDIGGCGCFVDSD